MEIEMFVPHTLFGQKGSTSFSKCAGFDERGQ